ncbi:2-iminoacetate synthase ThiH [Shewanella sp. C32]|uniref:2-iminoacetate synthase ThiH n=1 Tax=Shewanella electrica TaxID=515560 RepID=A0ABT2FL62_9GAMM|nr:2-iminoacetate synthase ThiH [Shewanella electrica]MCH1923847.1 2-iminoacetate synthase ThiH [Shewanella electrica]MCS4557066.1 2-iminoacetate synthase ThiH [Shewanella electrica]
MAPAFSERLDALLANGLDKQRLTLNSVSRTDVEVYLANPQRIIGNTEALAALISPAAAHYLEPLAQTAAAITRKRFGSNIQLYAPLYVSNLCANDCDYCGFSSKNPIKRKVLNGAELDAEIAILQRRGFDSVLLVAGEHSRKVGQDYFINALQRCAPHFSYLALEIQPLTTREYQTLVSHGLDAVMVYQESYQPAVYAAHHHHGKKRDFAWRLNCPDRAATAGVDKIGIGALLGLADWRIESLLLGHHLRYLEQRYWRSRFSVSVPRLRPCVGSSIEVQFMADSQLVQLLCALRLFSPNVELSLSTRESASLRDNLLALGITHMSAESSTEPGGYANPQSALDQFAISDERSVPQVINAIKARGLQPVFKDWQMQW